jgi:MoaA/NifB/PqqE/SkfB family radical SAM enzyme
VLENLKEWPKGMGLYLMVRKKKMVQSNRRDQKKETGKLESLIIFRCNCNCIMCSVGLQIDRSRGNTDYHAIRPFADVIKDIEKAKKMNANGFAFSGGEPTLREDLPELAKYAKKVRIGHIEVQSNGRRYVYKKYCQKLIDSGVNNFVVSLHSHRPEVHDRMTGVKGTFKQATQGMKNLNDLGQKVKINIVITKLNYRDLEKFVAFLLRKFKIGEIRFTMVMNEGNATLNPKGIFARMKEVAPHICRALDIAGDKVGCFVYNMVPCLLPGHERYINDLGQLDTILIGPEFETSLDESRKGKKIKGEQCKRCGFNGRCYGVWKNYAEIFGLDELKPVKPVKMVRHS